MTVAVDLNRAELNANGSLTAFNFNFAYSAADQIKVYVVDASDNAALQSLTTDYTLSATSGSSGTVTFGTPPANNTKVLILRQAPFTQGVDYQNNDALDAETLEGAFDKLTFQTQQLKAQVERSVRFDETLTGTNDPIINIAPTTRAGKLLSFDANGAFTVSQEVGVYRGDYATGVAYNARDIVKANNTHASVEDNIYFCNDFKNKLFNVLQRCSVASCNMIHLNINTNYVDYKRKLATQLPPDNTKYRSNIFIGDNEGGGTKAYYVKSSFLKDVLIPTFEKITTTADGMTKYGSCAWVKNTNSFVVLPLLIVCYFQEGILYLMRHRLA